MGVVSPEADLFVAQALFATITNANFDPARFVELIKKAISLRDALRERAQAACFEQHGGDPCRSSGPDWAGWHPADYSLETLLEKSLTVGIMSDPELDPDVRSLRELIIYGLKGMAAYTNMLMWLAVGTIRAGLYAGGFGSDHAPTWAWNSLKSFSARANLALRQWRSWILPIPTGTVIRAHPGEHGVRRVLEFW